MGGGWCVSEDREKQIGEICGGILAPDVTQGMRMCCTEHIPATVIDRRAYNTHTHVWMDGTENVYVQQQHILRIRCRSP